MATNCIGRVGPWGGNKAGIWRFELDGGRLIEIRIARGDYIDSIRFIYKDKNGDMHQSPKYGGEGGVKLKITFQDEDEELNEIGGTVGGFVTSLYFRTNKRTYGPWGRVEGTNFSLPVAKGKFVGFFGNCGDLLDSIGAILGQF